MDLHSRSYFHGDLHWENIFYDEKTRAITLIDVGSLHESLRKNREDGLYNTLGTTLLDFENTLFGLVSLKSLLSQEDLEKLEQAYITTYCSCITRNSCNNEILQILSKTCLLLCEIESQIELLEEEKDDQAQMRIQAELRDTLSHLERVLIF